MTTRSDLRQHAREDLEAKVLFVAQPVRTALEHADLVVESLDEAEGDLVLRPAVGRDPFPVALNHGGEFLVGPQALPLERGAPVLEEAACPPPAAVVPQLAEGFLEQVGGVQPLVGGEQRLESPAAAEGQILAMGEQGVLLPLDEAALAPGHPRVLALADLIERVAQMAQHLSNKRLACGAWRAVAWRKGFHMSMTTRRMRAALRGPSHV